MGASGLSLTLWHSPTVLKKGTPSIVRNAFEGMYFQGCLGWMMVCCMGCQKAVPVNCFSTAFYNMPTNPVIQDLPLLMQVRSLDDDSVIWKDSFLIKAAMFQILHSVIDMQRIVFGGTEELEKAYREKEGAALSTLIITETVIEKFRARQHQGGILTHFPVNLIPPVAPE